MPLDCDRIRKERDAKGLSQEEAAKRAGLKSRQHWYFIESGTKANITIETLERIAKALNLSPCDLLTK